ncbi:hypothetical protein PITC_036840 [Penicillium italicum]|uniref:Uncharacterized protein n=1 Tax=Penicillium italicum TaxID=40296 RepID=A0A0A2LAN6_PENIT|nr:hypothetical protein PITC_036840 [Penicillium italicum]
MANRVARNVRPSIMTPDYEIARSANPKRNNFDSDTGTNNLLLGIDFIDLKLDTGVIDSSAQVDLIDPHTEIKVPLGPRIDLEDLWDLPIHRPADSINLIDLSSENEDADLVTDVDSIDVNLSSHSPAPDNMEDGYETSSSADLIDLWSESDRYHVRNKKTIRMRPTIDLINLWSDTNVIPVNMELVDFTLRTGVMRHTDSDIDSSGNQYNTQPSMRSMHSFRPNMDTARMTYNRRGLLNWLGRTHPGNSFIKAYQSTTESEDGSMASGPLRPMYTINSISEPEVGSVTSSPLGTVYTSKSSLGLEGGTVTSGPLDTMHTIISISDPDLGSVTSSPLDTVYNSKSNSGPETGNVAYVPLDTMKAAKQDPDSTPTSGGSVPPDTVNSWSFSFAAGLTARLEALKLETGWIWYSGVSNLPQWFLASPCLPWTVAYETKMIKKGVTIVGWLRCGVYLFLRQDHEDVPAGENTDLTAYNEPKGSHRILKMGYPALNDCTVRAMAPLDDHEALVTGHDGGFLRIWNIRCGRVVCWLQGLDDTISCIEAKRNIIVAGSRDGTICVWDLTKDNNNNASLTLKGHTGAVLCLKLHGNYLVSGGHDRGARVWNIETGQCKHVLRGHVKEIQFVCMNDHAIATASADTTDGRNSEIQVWLPDTERFLAGQCTFKSSSSDLLTHLDMVGDDLIAADDCGYVVKWNVTSGERVILNYKEDDGVVALAISEKFVMMGKESGDIYLLDRANLHGIRLLGHASEIWQVGILDVSRVTAAYKKDGHAFLSIWHTSNIARPATKPSTPLSTTTNPSKGSAQETKNKTRSPSNPSPVEGVPPKDNGLTTRGRTLLPQRSNAAQDNGRGMGYGRIQPPSNKPKPRGDPSPTRQREISPAKKQTLSDTASLKNGVAPSRRHTIMRPGALKMPSTKITAPLSKSSAPSFAPPSPRKPPERRSPVQPPTMRRPPSPKKTEMLPPPRSTRSLSLRQPVSASKGPPSVATTHVRHKSQMAQNTKQAEPIPAIGQRARALSTYQRPSSPKKFSKPPTPTPGAEPQPGNMLISSSWPDIAALQTELLQLSLFHSNLLQSHAEWKLDSETRLRKKYDSVAGQYRLVLADETQRQRRLNTQALGLWLSNCREHRGPHDFSEQIQILSQVLQDVSDMIAGRGAQYSQAVKNFEDWLNQAELIRRNRGPGCLDIGAFIDPLGRSWKESLRTLNVRLELCVRQLQVLDILGFGQVEHLEQSALARVARNLTELIQLMTQEIRAMQTLESEVVRSERDSVGLLATQLAGSRNETRAPQIGAWRS